VAARGGTTAASRREPHAHVSLAVVIADRLRFTTPDVAPSAQTTTASENAAAKSNQSATWHIGIFWTPFTIADNSGNNILLLEIVVDMRCAKNNEVQMRLRFPSATGSTTAVSSYSNGHTGLGANFTSCC
jgi:hypothetical protein